MKENCCRCITDRELGLRIYKTRNKQNLKQSENKQWYFKIVHGTEQIILKRNANAQERLFKSN